MRRWIYTLPLRLRSLFRRSQVEQELDEELRFHVDRLVEEQVARGVSPDEARFAALRDERARSAEGSVSRRQARAAR